MPYQFFGKIFFIGLIVLVSALLVSALATLAGITTWYDFVESIKENGFTAALKKESALSLFFLFLLYPSIL